MFSLLLIISFSHGSHYGGPATHEEKDELADEENSLLGLPEWRLQKSEWAPETIEKKNQPMFTASQLTKLLKCTEKFGFSEGQKNKICRQLKGHGFCCTGATIWQNKCTQCGVCQGKE